jgi:ATP-dependent RNA helicase DDX52/ROK1
MKQAGCDVPDYMLKLKNPSKKLKRLREKKAPKRSKISTALKNGTFKHDKHDANAIDFNGNDTEETIEIENKATKKHVKNKRSKAVNKGITKKPRRKTRRVVSKELKKTKIVKKQ